MADKRSRRGQEMLKTILIVLLTISALGLAVRTQADSGIPMLRQWYAEARQYILGGGTSGPGQSGQTGLNAGLRPVRVAVCSEHGRYGVQYDAERINTMFEENLGALLGDALTGAGAPVSVSEEVWRGALAVGKPGVYYDFLGNVPLSALALWLGGAENRDLDGTAGRVLLAADGGDTVRLYYFDGASYYMCSTDLSADARFLAVTSEYTPNQAVFAFEQTERYPNLAPYVMILPDTPKPWDYLASTPVGAGMDQDAMNQLLVGLSFNPQTSQIYQAADGMVVREGTDTLRLSTSGVVIYHASSDQNPRYSVASDETSPSVSAMVEEAQALVGSSLAQWCGDADLYLMDIQRQSDGATVVYFGYLLDGAGVMLYEDGYAARVEIRDGYVSDFTLRFRAYQKQGTYGAVLPELQAAAAMAAIGTAQSELRLCYSDTGGTRVSAGWIAQ